MKNQNQYQIVMTGKDGETYIYTNLTPEQPFTLASTTQDADSVIYDTYASAVDKMESLRYDNPGIQLEVVAITIDTSVDDFIEEIEALRIGEAWEKSDTKVKRISETQYDIFNANRYQSTGEMGDVVDTLMIDFA